MTLAWDPSPGSGIGYLVSWGTQPGTYTSMMNVGIQTTAVVTGLASGTTYYFIVRAFNAAAIVSAASGELAVTTPAAPNDRDFNGDGRLDLLWQQDSGRRAALWCMGGTLSDSVQSFTWLSAEMPDWTLVAASDLNADGKTDLIWQHDKTRQVAVWYMTGPQASTLLRWEWIAADGVAGWRVVGAGDFNGDGTTDLVWLSETSNAAAVWYLGGAQGNALLRWDWLSASGVWGWTIAGVGDFNGDSSPDIVWQHLDSRQVVVWYMGGPQGNTYLGWSFLSALRLPGWTVVGSRDWNQDGTSDLVWMHDTTRQVAVWFMGGVQGTTRIGYTWLAIGGVPGWRAVAR